MGFLEGIFIASQEDIDNILGEEIWFGEVLGKHSDIHGTLTEEDLTLKSDDQEFITKMIEIFGAGTISGFNPFDYWERVNDDEYWAEQNAKIGFVNE
jgi:hypothetical protein